MGLVTLHLSNETKNALIFPTYREFESLQTLLGLVVPQLQYFDAVIICDDTGQEFQEQIKVGTLKLFEKTSCKVLFSFSNTKGGRGAAVHRGMEIAIESFPNLEYLLEADSDGSHRPQDIIHILRSEKNDFNIGSRYLKESEILGWPKSRRIFSYLLNIIIPRLLKLKCTDATNGLRRYSVECARELLRVGIKNTGFIYLSEQAVILRKAGFSIVETPIEFVNRTHGQSTVGFRELRDSIFGIISIVRQSR
jgi:dolichol-phosphate mannosyltransferase